MFFFFRPGYIAGVTNPAFEEHPTWWDVLCNINTGKISISPYLELPEMWELRESGEKDVCIMDNEFMHEVKIFLFLFFIYLFQHWINNFEYFIPSILLHSLFNPRLILGCFV